MQRMSGKEFAEKQVRRAQAAVGDFVKGVQKPKRSPIRSAIAKKQKMVNNFNAALTSGKWENNLGVWTDEEWAAVTAKKGGERYAPGVAAAQSKTEAFADEFLPFVYALSDELSKMDDSTEEGAIAKMVANVRGMKRFRRTRLRR